LAFYEKPRFADRFLYLASAGFIMLLLPILSAIGAINRKAIIVLSSILIALYGIGTIIVSKDWRNEEVFYTKLIKEYPKIPGTYGLLAEYYERDRQPWKAVEYQLKVLDHTNDVKEKATALDNIGRIYGINGQPLESTKYFTKELELEPSNVSALTGLGNDYYLMQDYDKAVALYEQGFAADPSDYILCFNLANIYDKIGNTDKAKHYYRVFLTIAPEYKVPDRIQYVRTRLERL
jgi:tetratricopeptide (TPR) repeat protein